MTNSEKIQALQNDEAFLDTLKKADSIEAFQQAFSAKGIEISESEIEKVMNASENGELDAAALEDVSGGSLAVILSGITIAARLLNCNQYTNWGRNGKKCKCGMHFF